MGRIEHDEQNTKVKCSVPNLAFFDKFQHPCYSLTAVFFLYLVLAIVLTWPLLLNLDTSLFGDYGDTRGGVWWIWAKTNGLLDSSANNLIAFPFGVPSSQDFSAPFLELSSLALSHLTNEVAAYNLFVLFSWILTALATYIFISKMLGSHVPALICGAIFGFCPGAIMQAAGGHSAYAFNAFIPVFLGALFYNRAQRTLLSAFYVAASFSLIVFTSLYFGYFAIYIAIFFVVFDLLSSKSEVRGAILSNCLFGGLFAVVLILPFEYKAILQQLAGDSVSLAKVGQIRDFGELVTYSSRPWDFLIPSIDHPIFGEYFVDFVRAHLHGSNVFEQTLYLGMVPLGLLSTGIILAIRGKFVAIQRTYFIFFALGALWMYFLSLPPQISFGGTQVPTLSFFAYKIAPMFRVYARFGILVNFFVACSAAVVLAHLYQHMKRARYYAMLTVLLPVLIFEYGSIPSGYALPVDQPPKVYSWLAQQPGDIVVAEYPMMNSDEAAFYTYLFWQRIHKKKLVNGAARDNEKTWDFFEKVKNLDDPNTPLRLKSVGVKYVIVHRDAYQEGQIPQPIKRYYPDYFANMTYTSGRLPAIPFPLKLVKTFGSDSVFAWDEGKK